MKTQHSGTLSRVTRPPEWKDTEMGERKEDIFMFNPSHYKQNYYTLLTLKNMLQLLATGK